MRKRPAALATHVSILDDACQSSFYVFPVPGPAGHFPDRQQHSDTPLPYIPGIVAVMEGLFRFVSRLLPFYIGAKKEATGGGWLAVVRG